MNKMNLGTKLAVGFGSVLLIALFLGGMAVISMNGVKTTAVQIQKEIVPEVAVANNVERWSLQTMYAMRGYAFTEEAQYLDQGRKNLEEVKKYSQTPKSTAPVRFGWPSSRKRRRRPRPPPRNMNGWSPRR